MEIIIKRAVGVIESPARPRTFREQVKRFVKPHGKVYAELQEDGQVTAGEIFSVLDRVEESFPKNTDKKQVLGILKERRRRATRRAMLLRGAEALATGITGAGIAEGIRRRSLKQVGISAAAGGSAVVGAAFLGEEYRERADRLRAMRRMVGRLPG